jgi:hypothetical protein
MWPLTTQAPWKAAVKPLNVTKTLRISKDQVLPPHEYVPLMRRCSPYCTFGGAV